MIPSRPITSSGECQNASKDSQNKAPNTAVTPGTEVGPSDAAAWFAECLILMLDSSILYDRFQEAKNAGTLEHTSIPVSSLQPQLSSSVPFGTLNGSSTMHHHHPSHQQQPPHLIHPQSLSHQPSMFQHSQSLSQGYHPSQFITHPGLMHDGNDSIMMNALHHDMQGVDPTMSMSL